MLSSEYFTRYFTKNLNKEAKGNNFVGLLAQKTIPGKIMIPQNEAPETVSQLTYWQPRSGPIIKSVCYPALSPKQTTKKLRWILERRPEKTGNRRNRKIPEDTKRGSGYLAFW